MPTNTETVPETLREAAFADLEAVRNIYNHYVTTSTATFDMEDQTIEQRREWFRQHQRENLPVIVAEVDGRVVGWASLSYYHTRCAYRTTVEFSLYLDPKFHRKGIG